MKGGLGKLMRQAQQMQENMQKAQEQLGELEVSGQSGGGMVTVTMSCRHEVRRVQIDDSMIGEDREMLEDLIAAAVNDAVRKVEQTVQEKFSGMASGISLPPGMKLPF
jgi:DNA-binding YbaB/EbfC family protein